MLDAADGDADALTSEVIGHEAGAPSDASEHARPHFL